MRVFKALLLPLLLIISLVGFDKIHAQVRDINSLQGCYVLK